MGAFCGLLLPLEAVLIRKQSLINGFTRYDMTFYIIMSFA